MMPQFQWRHQDIEETRTLRATNLTLNCPEITKQALNKVAEVFELLYPLDKKGSILVNIKFEIKPPLTHLKRTK